MAVNQSEHDTQQDMNLVPAQSQARPSHNIALVPVTYSIGQMNMEVQKLKI
jgi:hypothetical protein